MARRGHRRLEERDHTTSITSFAAPRLNFSPPLVTYAPTFTPNYLPFDDREFHPEGPSRPQRNIHGRIARLHIPKPQGVGRHISNRVTFNDPNVMLCVRRKQRREVLHALKRTRSGAGSKRNRTWRSNFSC